MIKKITAAFLAFAMLFALAACGENTDTELTPESTTSHIRDVKTKIAAPEGPIGFGLAKISTDRSYAYEVRFCQEMNGVYELLLPGKTDIAALPVELAAKAYTESGGAIKALAVNSLGMFHVADKTKTVKTLADLSGKTVYTSGKGTPIEYFVNFILDKNGIKDINIQYVETWEKLVDVAVSGDAEICIVPEPYLTEILDKTNPVQEETTSETTEPRVVGFIRPIDLNAEWEKAAGYKLSQSVIVARTDYINAKPEIIEEFLGFNEISVNFLTVSAENAALYMFENGFYERADAAMSAITSTNTVFLIGAEMKESINSVLDFIYKADSSLIGGAMPDDAFYYGI